jgi:DNA-binding GntR family transcriptional regulator
MSRRTASPRDANGLVYGREVSANESLQLPRQTLAHQVREALIGRIVSGDLPAGTRLVETRIAETYGTSQAPVREALRDLEAIHLVETRPRRGTFVRGFAEHTLRESYVVRAALEEAATRLVLVQECLPVEALRRDVALMWDAASDDHHEQCANASVAFHRHIVAAAGNELLLRSWESLWIDARTAAAIVAAGLDLSAVARDHEELLATLEGGDIERACRDTREHQWGYARLPHDAPGFGQSAADSA